MFEQFEGTSPVQERHRFDVAALASYLEGAIDDFEGPLQVEQFKGGQSNPTYAASRRRAATCCAASRPASCCRRRTRSIANTA